MSGNNKSNGKDWRELCAAASEEPDSDRLVSLVHQILQAFEELDLEPGGSQRRFPTASNNGIARS